MARPRTSIPTLRFHKPSGQWYYYRGEKRHYLGSRRGEAERRFRAVVSKEGPVAQVHVPARDAVLAEALAAYWAHALKHYADQRARDRIRRAIEFAGHTHGGLPVDDFRPRHFRDIRDKMLAARPELARGYINALMSALKTAIGWLAVEQYVPLDALKAANAVRALAPGEGGRETGAVEAVEDWVVDATRADCHPLIDAMIQVQRLTGCRPGELCRMKRQEISTTPAEAIAVPGLKRKVAARAIDASVVWLYGPSRHKNVHRGKVRIIAIGPEAQAILRPLVAIRKPGEHVFQPAEALSAAACEALGVGEAYTVRAYRNAICRAVARANRFRQAAAAKGLTPDAVLLPSWAPNQLRHAAIEEVADREGAESAAVMAGHGPSRRALDEYVQAVIQRSAQTAAKCG